MHIVVCVKAVPASTEVKMDPVTNTIVRDGGASVVNPFDATALEVALSLAEERRRAGEQCRVSVLSMGIPATEALLRDCLARGADGALLLSDRAFAGADTLATTYALSCGIAHLAKQWGEPDLVLCGKMAVDGDTAQIGPELAATLGATCATDVREVLTCGAGAVAVRAAVDGGTATLELPLPAVLTLAREAAQLRMPSIAGVRAAAEMPVEVLGAAAVGADTACTGLAGSPTQVVRSFVPESQHESVAVDGTPAEQALRLVEIIEGVA